MFEKLLKRITFTGKSKRYLKQVEPLLKKINELGEEYAPYTNEELQAKMHAIRRRVRESIDTLDDVLPEVFALTREASFRILGKKHFDEQILGGITVHRGKIAELKTGEGKTLMSSLPVILHSLPGKGVHIITVNDYLTARDHTLLKPLYDFFHISSGHITNETKSHEKHSIYLRDIVYCTCSRLAFDYLESNMKPSLESKYRFALHTVIVDEADNILLDESRVPLIISASSNKINSECAIINHVFKELHEYEHYVVNFNSKSAFFTKSGLDIIERFANEHFGISEGKLFSYEHIHHFHAFSNMLRANAVMKVDKNYAVVDNEIKVIDEATGRIAEGKKYSNGLHQAIEAKHGVKISDNTTIKAFITYIKFLNQYKHLGGMTGTGMTEANEFQEFYNLDVIQIPTHNPNQRIDHPTRLYRTKDTMLNGILQLIIEKHSAGQPILIGTGSVADSEELSARLHAVRIPHNVLNAKNHAKEAHIIAQAGRLGAVTVSTKMAGRGVDILLGGNPQMHRQNLVENEHESQRGLLDHINRIVDRERQRVRELGGLCVIMAGTLNTTKDEQQLAGRAGRQGDPGESHKFSALDEEFVKSATDGTSHLLNLAFPDDSVYLQGSAANILIGDIQAGEQAKGYEMIKYINQLDKVIHQQRIAIYQFRDYIMVTDQIKHVALKIISSYLDTKNLKELQEICDNYKIKYSLKSKSSSVFSKLYENFTNQKRKDLLEGIMNRVLEILTPMEVDDVRSIVLKELDNMHEILINQNEDLKKSAPLASIEQENLYVTYDHKSFAVFQERNQKMGEEILFSVLPRQKEKTSKTEMGSSFADLLQSMRSKQFNPFQKNDQSNTPEWDLKKMFGAFSSKIEQQEDAEEPDSEETEQESDTIQIEKHISHLSQAFKDLQINTKDLNINTDAMKPEADSSIKVEDAKEKPTLDISAFLSQFENLATTNATINSNSELVQQTQPIIKHKKIRAPNKTSPAARVEDTEHEFDVFAMIDKSKKKTKKPTLKKNNVTQIEKSNDKVSQQIVRNHESNKEITITPFTPTEQISSPNKSKLLGSKNKNKNISRTMKKDTENKINNKISQTTTSDLFTDTKQFLLNNKLGEKNTDNARNEKIRKKQTESSHKSLNKKLTEPATKKSPKAIKLDKLPKPSQDKLSKSSQTTSTTQASKITNKTTIEVSKKSRPTQSTSITQTSESLSNSAKANKSNSTAKKKDGSKSTK